MTSIEPALGSDRPAIEQLLTEAGLPLEGLELALSTAIIARSDGGERAVVGCAAIEPYGSAGLLRSVCVASDFRGTGAGRNLVPAAESLAAARGIEDLYLLTETAVDWFPRLGYEFTSRAAVPAALTSSPEFTSACPESAAVLRKRL